MDFEKIITDVRVNRVENMKNVKAFADIVIAGHFVCKGFKVMDGQKGLWVSMPSKPSKNQGQWEDIFHPITSEGRSKLFEVILEKFNNTEATPEAEQQRPPKKEVKPAETAQEEETGEDIPF